MIATDDWAFFDRHLTDAAITAIADGALLRADAIDHIAECQRCATRLVASADLSIDTQVAFAEAPALAHEHARSLSPETPWALAFLGLCAAALVPVVSGLLNPASTLRIIRLVSRIGIVGIKQMAAHLDAPSQLSSLLLVFSTLALAIVGWRIASIASASNPGEVQ